MESMKDILNRMVEEEYSGVMNYEKLINDLTEKHDKYVETVKGIQKQEIIHAIELANIMIDMGFKEPKVVSELTEIIHKKGYV